MIVNDDAENYHPAWAQNPAWDHYISNHSTNILPAKSDSDVMFCLQIDQGLIIDRSLVYHSYPQDRINTQVNNRFTLDQVQCTSYFYLAIVNKI